MPSLRLAQALAPRIVKTLHLALFGAILLALPALAGADRSMPRIEYKAERDRIEAEYKSAKEKCTALKGNEKDVCRKAARRDEKVRRAELEAKYTGTGEAKLQLAKTRAKADREVAEAKCESRRGKEKAECKNRAKADEQKALADAKRLT